MHADLSNKLLSIFHAEIPLTVAIGIDKVEFDGASLRLAASLEGNTNVHGTAFAGSLFSISALAAWGLLYLKLLEDGLQPQIVISSSQIRYCSAVRSRIEAQSRLDEADYARFRKELRDCNKSYLSVGSQIVVDSTVAVLYTGEHVGVLK